MLNSSYNWLPSGASSKELACQGRRHETHGFNPWVGKISPGGGHDNPLQYSWLENHMNRGAWWTIVHGVTKSRTWLKWLSMHFSSVQSLSHVQLLWPMDCGTPGFPVHHQLSELVKTHVHWVGDAIQPSHPLSSPSPAAFNLSQHQGLFPVSQLFASDDKVLALQLQHQSLQWIFRVDFL